MQARKITTTGCPNTPTASLNPNNAAVQTVNNKAVPAKPMIASSTTSLQSAGGTVGLAYDGAAFYSCYGGSQYGTCSAWASDAVQFEGNTFNCVGGHASGSNAGYVYHYHVPPTALLDSLGQIQAAQASTSAHSPQIGWAYDGFPVYGPNGENGNMMAKCGSSAATSSNCLDDCNGQLKEISSVDAYKYRYYTTGRLSDGTTMPYTTAGGAVYQTSEDYFPHVFLCFKGCCPSGMSCGYSGLPTCDNAATDGFTSAFTPAAHAGCAAQYGTGCCTSGGYQASSTCSSRASASTMAMTWSGSPTSGSGSCAYTSTGPAPTAAPVVTSAPTAAPVVTSAPTAAPVVTSAPTAAPTATTAAVSKSVTLVGITTAQFGTTQQTAFKTTVANNAGTVCGVTGATRACTASDVALTISRRDVSVSYTLTVAATASTAAGSTLDAYTASSQFATDLTSAGVSVTSTSTSAAASDSESSDSTTILIAVGGTSVFLVLIVVGYFCMTRSRPEMEASSMPAGKGQGI